MAATIIQFANLPRGRTVVLKDLAVGLIERLGQNLHVLIPACLRQMFQHEGYLRWNCSTCLGAEPPAPVSNNPPPASSGTIDSILAEVPSSMIGNRSVR